MHVRVRPIEPSDAEALLRFHARLSPETTYYRFFSPHPRLSPAEVERFTNVDHVRREALVAERDGEIVAVARFDRVGDPGEAEIAFVVEDAWQGRGIGTLLMARLVDRAREVGLTRLVADTLSCNRRMQAVFQHSGLVTTRRFDGEVMHVDMPLTYAV